MTHTPSQYLAIKDLRTLPDLSNNKELKYLQIVNIPVDQIPDLSEFSKLEVIELVHLPIDTLPKLPYSLKELTVFFCDNIDITCSNIDDLLELSKLWLDDVILAGLNEDISDRYHELFQIKKLREDVSKVILISMV